jgi:MFS family permease
MMAQPATTTSPHPYPDRWRVVRLLGVARLILILDVTVVAVALPNISTDLGSGRQLLIWVVSGYTLAFGGPLLLAGASLLAELAATGWAQRDPAAGRGVAS